MMPELNKCACGGNAELVEGEYASFQNGYAVYCTKCHIKLGVTGRLGEPYEWTTTFDTEEAAADAWNEIMQERTCRVMVPSKPMFVDDYFRCSECDAIMYPHFKYCPMCGAKVVHNA